MLVNFIVVQFVPGGPVERVLAQIENPELTGSERASGGASDSANSTYRGAQGIPPELIKDLEKQFGFDKPAYERFFIMLWNYARFDLGESFYQDKSVLSLIADKLPVSISLGLWSTLLTYIISIPLGVAKAVRHGDRFDIVTSGIVVVAYAVPAFLFAILLVVLFAGGTYFDLFPLRGLTSPDFEQMSLFGQVLDYFWHLALPVIALTLGGFAGLTLLTKNSFLEEIHKQYAVTAKAKGNTPKAVLYGHVFRNAMLIIIAGLPAALLSIFFTGSLLIEVIFSLDGLGLLGFESVINRDYPVVLGTLFVLTLLGLIMKLVSDVTYMIIDPRIDFSGRN